MQVPEFADFASALDSASYKPVPDDWLIAIGDVAGSTPAIAAGHYKDVNLAGADAPSGILCFRFMVNPCSPNFPS